jgi:hypothetical protein
MRVLTFCFEHAALGFALGFGVLAVRLILPLLHLANGSRLRPLAGDPVIGIAGQRHAHAEDGQENPRSNLSYVHDFSDGQILAAKALLYRERLRSGILNSFLVLLFQIRPQHFWHRPANDTERKAFATIARVLGPCRAKRRLSQIWPGRRYVYGEHNN